MRLNKKMLAVTAILAVSILAGCGASGSGSAASSAASSEPASSTASSAPAEQTGAVQPIEQGTLDDMKTENYKFAADITAIKDGQMTMTVYRYDAYEKDAIDALKKGDVISTHMDGTDKTQDVTVESIDRNEENGYVTINGGVEQGGMELCMDHDVYRTNTFDDSPVYYEVGELTLPLAEDVSVSDSSADPQADAVITEGASAVEEMFNAAPENWNCGSTTVFTDNGKVSGVLRVWVP